MSAGQAVGISVAAVATLVMLFVGCGYLRRRQLAASRAVALTPLLEGEEGSYVPPVVQSQPVQPYSSQAYHLDMEPQNASPPYSVQSQYSQPHS